MLRHPRRILTIIVLFTMLRFPVFPHSALAQAEESIAPWRMTELDQLDFPASSEQDFPLPWSAIRDSASSALYSFQFASKLQYSAPRAQDAAVSPYRQGMRGTLTRSRQLSVGVALEKDPGEKQFWDYASIAVSAELPRNKIHLILGDHRIHYGSGLVIRTARNYGLPYSADAILFPERKGIQAYSGWDENISLRGAALKGKYHAFDISIWGSRRSRDAQLDSAGNVAFFSNSGLHRTDAEISRRNACLEEVAGSQVGLNLFSGSLRLGAVAYRIRWNHPILKGGSTLTNAMVGGAQADFKWEPVDLSLEAACDDASHPALISALRIHTALTRSLLAVYYVDPEYFSPLSASLDFDLGKTANRQGAYASLAFPRLFLNPFGFCHVYSFPRRSPNTSRGGQDLQLQINQMVRRPVSVTASSRWVQEDEAETGLKTNRWFGTGIIQVKPDAATNLQTEIRLCRSPATNAVGRMLRFQFEHFRRFHAGLIWRSNLSAGIYKAESPLVKLYWYDVDWSGNIFLRQLQESGGIWQLEMAAYYPSFGKFGWSFYWDVPAETVDLASYYSIYVNYQFP